MPSHPRDCTLDEVRSVLRFLLDSFSPPDFLSFSLSLSADSPRCNVRGRSSHEWNSSSSGKKGPLFSPSLLLLDRRQRFCGLKPGKSCIHERAITGAALRFASLPRFPSLPSRSPSISYLSFALLSEAAVYRAKGRGRRTRGSAEEASEGRAKIRQSYSPRYDTNNKNHKHSDPLIKSFREDVPKPPFPRDEDRIVASTGHLFPPSFRVILSGHERCGYMGTRLSSSRSRAAAARARASPCERPSRLYVVVASIARL